MRRRKFVGLLLPLLVIGCDSFTGPDLTGGVSLVVVEDTYSRGESAEARLINDSGGPIGYNLCMAMWDRSTSTGWERVVPLRMCDAAIYTLEDGDEVLLRETVDAGWSNGTYRFVLSVREMPDGGELTVYSDSFDVTN